MRMGRLQDEIRFRGYPKRHKLPLAKAPSGKRNQYSGYRQRWIPGSLFARQRVVVKTHYTKLKAGRAAKSLARHKGYLQREGVGVDGKRPELFTEEGKQANMEYLAGEPRYYRVILSPEHGEKLEMQAFTRRFMEELDKATGRELVWSAAMHYNTEHPHAHIVIRGLDASLDLMNPVYLSPTLIKGGMREIAERLATLELGYRSQREIEEQLWRETTQERLTSIDRALARHVDPLDHTVSPANERQKARLDHLVKTGYARKLPEKVYQLVPTWDADLKSAGEKADIIKNIYAETRRKVDAKRMQFYNREMVVEGELVEKGIDNEQTDSQFGLIQKKDGDVVYYTGAGVSRAKVGDQVRADRGKLTVLERGKTVDRSAEPEKGRREPELGL